MKLDAVILAGGKTEGELKEKTGIDDKALIPFKGERMIECVVSSLKLSKYIGKIIVVCDKEKFDFLKEKVDEIVPSTPSLLQNIINGIKYISSEKILLVSSDIPLVTSNIIDEFIEQCQEKNIDGYYPIIEKNIILSKYPNVKRTYAKVKQGIFTGGNIGIVNPQIFIKHHNIYEKLIGNRKSPIRLVKILGLFFLIKFIFGKLSIEDVEKKFSEMLGNIKLKAVIVSHPEIGIDVDKISDMQLVEQVLK